MRIAIPHLDNCSATSPDDRQARAVPEIIQRVNPDILLLQEFDYDARSASLDEFMLQ